MFLTNTRAGYDSHGQFASGLFLILVQPKTDSLKYPMMESTCATCGKDRDAHDKAQSVHIPTCEFHGVLARLKRRAAQGTLADTPDAELNEQADANCPYCQKRAAALEQAGCRYFQPKHNHYQIRAIVRKVSMRQCGNFMMGRARAFGHTLILSGAYGSDGLPDSVPDAVYDKAIPLPADLYDAWKNGGGWNSAGSEADKMREWAMANLKLLKDGAK